MEAPLFFGRFLRILLGLGLCAWLVMYPPAGLLWQSVLVFFGVSLVIGGIMAHPGCEVCVLPNLLLRQHMQCY